MKAKLLTVLILCSLSCSDKKMDDVYEQSALDIFSIDATFPLSLDKVKFSHKDETVKLDDHIKLEIENSVKDYYATSCLNDSLHTYKDTYIATIRLKDSLQTLYLILLKNYPTGELSSKVLFYNSERKEFIGSPMDFLIYGLFDFENNELKPSYFKTTFKIDTPEIEREDFDGDGINDFKFTRLYHNGTSNAIHSAVLTTKNSRIDTLEFKETVIGKGTYK